MNFQNRHLVFSVVFCLALASCGGPDPSKAPVINTPAGAKIELSKVSLQISNPQLTREKQSKYSLSFDYTVDNQAGANIVFPCLYNQTDALIEVNLIDRDGVRLILGKRPLEGLTLTEPRPLRIPIGKSTRNYRVPVMPELREPGDPIRVRVRLHAPSRYDELRSSIEASGFEVPWP